MNFEGQISINYWNKWSWDNDMEHTVLHPSDANLCNDTFQYCNTLPRWIPLNILSWCLHYWLTYNIC